MGKKELVSNKVVYRHYEIFKTYEAGLVLLGTEVKSLRENGGDLRDSYVRVKGSEPWLVGAHIAPYKYGNVQNHEEKRERKLLMHKREIAALEAASGEKGLTIVVLSLYLSKGRVKAAIATAKGLKDYDKRLKIKAAESDRAIRRALREG